ncbi:hypothetical protein [Achromobacter sp. CSND-B12]|uniref:hypothetical protein n=1 Tax=Achromobacter sp. CSND-B12 TaxID=3462570 RepID=UPI00406A5ED2
MNNPASIAQLGLTDDEIEALALKHIAPGYERLRAVVPASAPYQNSEQFRRVKALLADALHRPRAPLADERIAFETWALAEGFQPEELRICEKDGDYISVFTNESWIAWKARATLASAPVADERAAETFAERFALALKPVAYTTKRGAVYRGKSTQVGSENLCTISQAVYEFRAALASLPAPDERQAVAYLDLGTGGYMDMGTDLTDEQLAALPKGRHMLAIIGSHGVNGYSPCALESAPVADERAAQEYGSPADVAQRIEQYLAQDGRMNSGTQLLYEAMKALRASQGNRNDR